MSLSQIPELKSLSQAEKLQLLGELWDDLAASAEELPVSEEERRLLVERLQAHEAAPEAALTLEQFKQRLSERR